MNWQKLQKAIFIVFLVIVIGSILAFWLFSDNFNLERVRQYISGFGVWAPLVFILIYIAGTIFIPSTPFMAIAGVLFGFRYGLFYTVIGGFLSSIFVFAISRRLGKEQMEKTLASKYLKQLDNYNKKLEKGAILDIIIFRVTPVMPFNGLNILLGVSRVSVRDYIVGTLVGLIPSNILTVYFGDLISKLF
jgi:uncharacterized membrane protein YdjX (TVP38/TMEM64 family)